MDGDAEVSAGEVEEEAEADWRADAEGGEELCEEQFKRCA